MNATSRSVPPIGLMAALPQELQSLLDLMPDECRVERGGRTFWVGHLQGQPVVAVLSGIGKVAAAITATLLIDAFGVDQVWFTGVAGGLGEDVRVGDVVIADALLQHDLDASPLFPKFEIPGWGLSQLSPPPAWASRVVAVVEQALSEAATDLPLHSLGLGAPRVHRGLIVSGDQFVASADDAETLRRHLPNVLAVEMEGAAVAQVCHAFGVPCLVMRTISDRADASAHLDFTRFVEAVASGYALAMVSALLRARPDGGERASLAS